MSTPNPLTPQGSRLEQNAKRKTNLPVIVAVFVGIHAVVFGCIMMAGCKPESKPVATKAPEPNLPPLTPPADLGSPVTPAPVTPGGAAAPGTLSPVGSAPGLPAPGLAPLPLTPSVAPVAPVAPPVVAPTEPAPAPAPVPVAPSAEAKVHVVAKNDSFYTMSKKYGVGMKAIEAANAGVDSTKLKIGQKINIPASAPKAAKAPAGAAHAADSDGTYTIKSGDNLGSIAKRHGTTVAKLRDANGLKTDQIKVGQKLKVPAGGAKKPSEPSVSAAPAPKADVVPALPPSLPPLGEPAPKPPGQ
ncbi:MAG: LysM peptidoglycan-binding domain-containing protein [Verrucomicrobia bacterium]|nr:LysM peptidoglycan-binding domain-containing protein [Verrucomicrobiota bacterium]